jgi:hypothetical protein
MKQILDLIGEIGLAFVPPKWQPFAKAVLAAVPGLVLGVAHGITSGAWDQAALIAGVTGILSAVLVYAVPNLTPRATRSRR